MFGLAAAAAAAAASSGDTSRNPLQMMMVRDRLSAMQHHQHHNGVIGSQLQQPGGGSMMSMLTKPEMSSPLGDSGSNSTGIGNGLGSGDSGLTSVPLPAGTVRNWCMQPSVAEHSRLVSLYFIHKTITSKDEHMIIS
jgi:hypothetical protein